MNENKTFSTSFYIHTLISSTQKNIFILNHTRIPSSHFSAGSNLSSKSLKVSSTTAFPVISSCVRFSSLNNKMASQLSPTLILSFLNSSIICLTSLACDKGDAHRYRDVSTGWEPISLYEMFNVFKDLSSFKGSNAVKLLIWLLLRFKQTRSCSASKPVIATKDKRHLSKYAVTNNKLQDIKQALVIQICTGTVSPDITVGKEKSILQNKRVFCYLLTPVERMFILLEMLLMRFRTEIVELVAIWRLERGVLLTLLIWCGFLINAWERGVENFCYK